MVTPGASAGRTTFSALLGTPVVSRDGARVGQVGDLVVDLGVDLDRVPVTRVLIEGHRRARRAVPWTGLVLRPQERSLALVGGTTAVEELAPSEVLVRRDVLDSPVVLVDPPGRTRVSDVVLEVDAGGAWVTGLDLSASGALRRLIGGSRPAAVGEPVQLSRVHLASAAGHRAQLAVPGALVFRLGPEGMAEVLTRVSVAHARDILRVADHGVRDRAVSLLHPHVRSRVTGAAPPPRRTRRLAGWRLHRPGGREVDG